MRHGDSQPFMAPVSELPSSESQGHGCLDLVGETFCNLPPPIKGYVRRRSYEQELMDALLNDRHPVVTLTGRGGIGKTSLALYVLDELTSHNRFDAIIWFSSRDIDLLPEGPKLVKPHMLRANDIAEELVRLLKSNRRGREWVSSKQIHGGKPCGESNWSHTLRFRQL